MKLKQLFVKHSKNVNREDTKRFIGEEKTLLLALLKTRFQRRSWGTRTYENTMLGSQNGSVVVPFEPEQSLLYTKCSGEHTEGERMPQDDLDYFDEHPEKLQLIYDWIYFGCLE